MKFWIDTRLARLLATHRGVVAMCAVYLVFLLAFRPATPFEWDEVLYQRALDRYDVAAHSPHPPGAPVYVAAAASLRLLGLAPQLAAQLTTIATGLAALVILYALVLRLGGERREGLLAAGALALVPGFAFYANVGMTDVPATAGVLAVVLAATVAIDHPRRLPVLAITAALAVGIRPQVLSSIAIPGLWATLTAVRARQWRPLAKALLFGAGATVVIWTPPILLTGAGRYYAALKHLAEWMTTNEVGLRLPAARLTSIARHWFSNPLGAPEIAAVFWLVILAGAVQLFLSGRRRALWVPLLAAGPYLALGMFTFNMLSAVRYGLPGIALVTALAGAAPRARTRGLRAAIVTMMALWATASVAWGMRAYRLRLEPAPVWAGLEWIREHVDAAQTAIVSDGSARPHIEYVLGPAAFLVEDWSPGTIYPSQTPDGRDVVILTRLPIPGWKALFQRNWHSRRLLQLAFGRYGSYAVQSPPEADAAAFSPAWQVEGNDYVLWGTGQVRLPGAAAPATATICPLNTAVTVVGAVPGRATVQAGECRPVAMQPGRSGGLFVVAPKDLHAVMRPLAFDAVPRLAASSVAPAGNAPDAEYLRLLAANDTPFPSPVAAPRGAGPGGPPPRPTAAPIPTPTPTPAPQPLWVLPVARTAGHFGAQWQTEMALANPTAQAATVRLELVLAGKAGAPRRVEVALAPGEKRVVADTLGDLFDAAGAGAVRVVRGDPAVTVGARTYDSAAKAPRGRFIDGIEEGSAFMPGRAAVLAGLGHDPASTSRKRTNLGVLNVTAIAIELEVAVSDAEGRRIGAERLRLAPREFRQINDLFGAVGATAAAAGSARVTVATRGGAFLAYASVVRRDPPSVTYVLPRPARPPSPQPAGGAAVPRATPAAPSSSKASPAGGSAPPSPR